MFGVVQGWPQNLSPASSPTFTREYLGDGTVSLPAFTFTSDTDTGIYRIGANNIGVAANGAKVLDIATTGLGVTGTLVSSGALTITAGGLTVTAGGATITAGNLGIGAAQRTETQLYLAGTTTVTTDQRGILLNTVFSTAATSTGYSMFINGAVATGAITLANYGGIRIDTPTLNGNTITTVKALYISAMTTGGTNNYGVYIDAPSGGATNNIGLYNAGTTFMGGALTLSNAIGSLAGGTADVVKLGAYDLSAGNATLSLATEAAVAVDVAVASTNSLQVRINGVTYKLLLA